MGSDWSSSVLDEGWAFGGYASQVILPSGWPAVAYWNSFDCSLEYASFDGETWHKSTIDAGRRVGEGVSLAVIPSGTLAGQPAISYYDFNGGDGDLKYAWFDGVTWQSVIVDSQHNTGWNPTLLFQDNGCPVISYYDATDADLKFAWQTGRDFGSGWRTVVVDQAGIVGWNARMALLGNGQPIISYYRDWAPLGDLKFAWHTGSSLGTGWRTTLIEANPLLDVGRYSSITVLSNGQPAVAYEDSSHGSLKYAAHNGDDFTQGWHITVVDPEAGMHSSMTVLDERPVIAYIAQSDLRFAWLNGTQWQHTTVDAPSSVQMMVALTLLPDGMPMRVGLDAQCTAPPSTDTAGRKSLTAAIGDGVMPLIAYFNSDVGDLRLAWFEGYGWFSTLIDQARHLHHHSSSVLLPDGRLLATYTMTYPSQQFLSIEQESDGTWTKQQITDLSGGWWPSMTSLPAGRVGLSYDWGGLHYAERDQDGQWRVVQLDNGAAFTDIVALATGQPAISYFYFDDLKYAELVGEDSFSPADWQLTIVDSEGKVGQWTSMVVLPDGQPAIAYQKEFPDYDLRFAWRGTTGTWHTVTVDADGDVGTYTSVSLLGSGQPAISYFEGAKGDLKFAWHEGGDLGAGWRTTTIDAGDWVGRGSSLSILPDGTMAVAYCDETHDNLKYATHPGPDYATPWDISVADDPGGAYPRLHVLPTGGLAVTHFSQSGDDLRCAVYPEPGGMVR